MNAGEELQGSPDLSYCFPRGAREVILGFAHECLSLSHPGILKRTKNARARALFVESLSSERRFCQSAKKLHNFCLLCVGMFDVSYCAMAGNLELLYRNVRWAAEASRFQPLVISRGMT
jgi:hypothetical protein